MANLLSRVLGVEVPVNRVGYKLSEYDMLLVFTLPARFSEGRVMTDEELVQIANSMNVYAVFIATNIIKNMVDIVVGGLRRVLGLQ